MLAQPGAPGLAGRRAPNSIRTSLRNPFPARNAAHLPGAWEDAAAENSHQSTSQNPDQRYFHTDGKNFLFLDGHVRWYTKSGGPFAQNLRDGGRPGDREIAGIPPYGDWPANEP